MNSLGYSLTLTNEDGLSIDLYDDPGMAITATTGFGINADITTQTNSGMDGSYYVSSTVPARDISITVQYFSDVGDSEADKLRLLRVCRVRQKIKLHYISPHRNQYIYGYIKGVDTPENTYPMTSQITMLCPDPFWASDEEEITVELPNGEVEINYDGDAPTGFVTTIRFSSSFRGVRITMNDTDKFESDVKYASTYNSTKEAYKSGNVVEIDSRHLHKQIRFYTSETSSTYQDYFLTTSVGLLYPQLKPGKNKIKIEGLNDSGESTSGFKATIKYQKRYSGG